MIYEIIGYLFLCIAFMLGLYLVMRKKNKVKEYKTPYHSAYDKAKADFKNRNKK